MSKWCTRDTRTPTFKLFRSRLRGLILPWFIAAIKEVKISRHLRVVLNDSIPFNYTHLRLTRSNEKKSQYFSHSTAILLHSQGSHWKTALQINWFSPSLAEIVRNSYNFPLRRLFHQNDLVLLFMFYSWNTGFTLQGFRSITKLSRRRYIMCGIYKARYILCCISAWKKTLKITRVHFLRSERQLWFSLVF